MPKAGKGKTMIIKNTNDVQQSNGIKILVYGEAGAGKTRLISTLPTPFVIDVENRLLSITGNGIAYKDVKSTDDLIEVYTWLVSSEEAKQYESIVVDSISELSEICYLEEVRREAEAAKQENRKVNSYAPYGNMASSMINFTKKLLLINKHVYFIARLDRSNDELNRIVYNPATAGQKLAQTLPHLFDEFFALRVEKDNNGVERGVLQCTRNNAWHCRDASGKLSAFETPDLGAIIRKIGGHNGE